MSREVADRCLEVLAATDIPTVDITGGAPEMAAQFRHLVRGARALGRHVMDRCNLSILLARPYADLVDFLAEHEVEVVAIKPHYRQHGTDRQRGDEVFDASIEALRRLNAAGYGRDPRLRLVLVTNPVGAFLAPGQALPRGRMEARAEASPRRRLRRPLRPEQHADQPLPRVARGGRADRRLHAPAGGRLQPGRGGRGDVPGPLSVGWDGRLFDCDFNQMLDLVVGGEAPGHIDDFDLDLLASRRIVTRRHCFGCTAGSGSSCGGATT